MSGGDCPADLQHRHRPGTIETIDSGDVRSTCTRCRQPIAQLYIDDPDRLKGWGPWRRAPVTVP